MKPHFTQNTEQEKRQFDPNFSLIIKKWGGKKKELMFSKCINS